MYASLFNKLLSYEVHAAEEEKKAMPSVFNLWTQK
jgi:hypothetical protein